MTKPGEMDAYSQLRTLNVEDRRGAFEIVSHNLGALEPSQALVVPVAVDSGNPDVLQAAADTLEMLDGTERLVWRADHGENI